MTRPLNPLSVELSEQLRERFQRLLVRVDELRALALQPGAWQSPVDLCELEDAIVVRVELPGVQAQQVRVSLFNSVLKIEGRKEREPEVEPVGDEERPLRFLCLEREYGVFSLTVTVRWPIDIELITAKLEHGVLQVRLPKTKTCGREILIPIAE
jgi:HSP20 family molecular chaperone IbpA